MDRYTNSIISDGGEIFRLNEIVTVECERFAIKSISARDREETQSICGRIIEINDKEVKLDCSKPYRKKTIDIEFRWIKTIKKVGDDNGN